MGAIFADSCRAARQPGRRVVTTAGLVEAGAKAAARALLGRYAIYHVYGVDLPVGAPATEPDPGLALGPIRAAELLASSRLELRRRAGYAGAEARGFGAFVDSELVALQWYWWGARQRRERATWPTADGEAESVELFTLASHRGRGLATWLKIHSAHAMAEAGFTRLVSRIWHSNRASIRVSEKAGWRRLATVVEARPLGRPVVLRWRNRS